MPLFQNNVKVRACLDALTFIQLMEDKNLVEAVAFAEKELKLYKGVEKARIPTKNEKGENVEEDVVNLTKLICYE